MARSLLQRRLENDRQRIAAWDAALKYTHHRRKPKSRDCHEIALTLEWVSDHKSHLIRAAADWKPQLKTRDESRATLAAARHLFARFPAPAHLERIWLETAGLDREEIAFRNGAGSRSSREGRCIGSRHRLFCRGGKRMRFSRRRGG